MAKLTPYIHSEDSRAQAEFYVQALGGEVVSVMTFENVPGTLEANKNKVMHLHLVVAGGNELFFSDSVAEPIHQKHSISLSLSFEKEAEGREAFSKLSEGGQVKFPFDLQPWGAYYGEVQDKYNVAWMIVKLV
jgi:PhnB protein